MLINCKNQLVGNTALSKYFQYILYICQRGQNYSSQKVFDISNIHIIKQAKVVRMLQGFKDQKSRKQSLKVESYNEHATLHTQTNQNNPSDIPSQRNTLLDDDQVVKQLMLMLGNRRELQIRSKDGKMLKLSLDLKRQMDQCSIDGNLQNQINRINIEHNLSAEEIEAEAEEYRKFEKILDDAITDKQQVIEIKQLTQENTNIKKINLNTKKNKIRETNQSVIQFIQSSSKTSGQSSLITTSETIPKNIQKLYITNATKSIQFLKENHPQDQEHLEIISQRMIELEKMQQDKLKLDQQISDILSASFSNSCSGMEVLSWSALSINGLRDPLCQIFNNYLRKNAIIKKSNSQKMPSFLFLYSQPMIDLKGGQINQQINYFQEENIIQKTLKQCKIDYIKQQATVQKLNYWIKQNIQIIHYCGHGEKNYLLFEGEVGQSIKLDLQQLEKILQQQENPLQLVFVASCHSESTGKIFKDAGAVHVICIRDSYQILDSVCQQFARIFYCSCINDKMSICDAFTFAKKQINLSHKFTSHECSKFIMIKDHCQNSCKFYLNTVKEGRFRDLTYRPYFCKFIPSRVENFIARPKDLHQILKLINNKNRFITVIGHSGIGKSTLIRQLVRFIHFRNIFKDGVIYLDIRSCQKMLKIFQVFSMQLFENSPVKLNKSCTENVQKIVQEIHEREVLIVLDNCQSIILSEDKNQFKKLIELIMKNCDNVYFIFTNRVGIKRQIDYCSEKLYELGKFTVEQAQSLFFLRVPRKVGKNQLEEFLNAANVNHFSEHPFFQFLNGHPEAICMTASLLSERSLCQLYSLLMKPSLTKALSGQNENIGTNQLVETALKISLNVLKNKYKDSTQMIKTLSLLPIGFDSEMMCKIFGTKWKQIAKRLIDHALIHCLEMGGSRYYAVNPYIIILVQSEITHDEKLKLHEKICEQFSKRIQKIYRHIGTVSQSSQRAQEQFFTQQENYKAIILRELSFFGDKSKIKKLYYNLFQADYSDDEFTDKEEDTPSLKLKTPQAIQGMNKKRVHTQKILQAAKKDSISLMLVGYITILLITNSPTCSQYLQYGIILSRIKAKIISQANLLRVKACLYLTKNKYYEAKDCFLKSWNLYAMQGCGLGSASCQSAIGYLRFLEEEYAPAKKHMENALKYYDQIAHPFGKYYLNRWLCDLKTKMNKTEKQLISHREQAEKLLKEAKSWFKSNNIHQSHHSSLFKHKMGIFSFRLTCDNILKFENISLFLQSSFQIDVRPKMINEVLIKKPQEKGNKFSEDILYKNDEQRMEVSGNKIEHGLTKRVNNNKKN